MADHNQGASQASQMNELPRLRRLSDDKTHTLNEQNIIGRHADCDLFIDDEKGVSRKHARLTVEDGVVHVEDLGSLNGTLVNGIDCTGKQALSNGDILVFDEQEYELFVPYQDTVEFDPAMTIIADRSAIKKRIEKKREKKKLQAANTPESEPSAASAAFSKGRAANHTIIDQPRKSVSPSMRIVDKEFLKEVHDKQEAADKLQSPEAPTDKKNARPALEKPTAKTATKAAAEAATKAAREAFDVSDDEVEEILHTESPGGAPTRFVSDQRDSKPGGASVGSAPFLSRRDAEQDSIDQTNVFTRGTRQAESRSTDTGETATGVAYAQLIVLDGGRHYRLPLSGDQTSWSVGSSTDADLVIEHQGVSADHAIVLREEDTWTLCDRGSEGGCTVNGFEVNVARIQLGDRIRIGSAECLFAAAETERPQAPEPKSARAPMPQQDPFGDDPMDSPRMRIDIPMDERIWDEHEQQLYRDTSRDQILKAKRGSSRHEPEERAVQPRRQSGYASWEPPAERGKTRGLARFLPSAKKMTLAVLVLVTLAVLGTLAYLIV